LLANPEGDTDEASMSLSAESAMQQRLFLDTEFNGHGGELISLALACTDGSEWYGVLPLENVTHPWVSQNVIPKLFELPPTDGGAMLHYPDFRVSLHAYLKPRSGAVIYADWPADFGHLMQVMIGPSFNHAWAMQLRLHLINTPDGEPKPEIPHNALSDARALMKWYMETQVPR
jgi:hypothetical protein